MQFGIALADKILEDSLEPQKVQEINREMQSLVALQERIDAAIDQMPESADKGRVLQKRAEARGYFNQYVLPAYMAVYNAATSVKQGSESAWDTVKDWWSGLFSGADFGNGQMVRYQMGVAPVVAVPLVPIAWVTAAGIVALSGTAIYYIKAQRDREIAILSDPSFTTEQKRQLIEGGTLSGILKNAQSLLLVGGIVGLVYIVYRSKEK